MFKIFFARSVGEVPQLLLSKAIVIRDANINWNDFGYYSLFDFSVTRYERTVWIGRLRLGFLGFDESPSEYVEKLFSKVNVNLLPAESFSQFFSMQLDEDAYLALVGDFGRDGAIEILESLQDIVALRAFDPRSLILESALKTDVFALSLIRSDGAFAAFKNFNSIFLDNYRKSAQAPTELVIPPFSIGSFTNQLSYNFRFVQDGLFPKRIAVIVGANGVGKSQSLRQALNLCLGGGVEQKLDGKVIAVCTSGEANSTFPPLDQHPSDRYVRISASSSDSQISDNTLSATVFNLSRDRWQDFDSFRWHAFHRAVSGIVPFSALAFVPIDYEKNNNVGGVVEFDDLTSRSEFSAMRLFSRLTSDLRLAIRHGDNYHSLSSGQLAFIKLAAQLAAHVTEGALVLMDEPETHLHPKFVSQFIAMLDSILGATRSTAIIATHSPFVVREVSNDQVHIVYKKSSNGLGVGRPRLKTFGADVGAISASVFGDELTNEGLDKLIENILSEPERYKNWESDLFNELSVAAVLYIRRMVIEGDLNQ